MSLLLQASGGTGFPNDVLHFLNYDIFTLGDAQITPLKLISLIVLIALLIWVSGRAKALLINRILGRTRLDIGAKQAIGTISRYLVLFIGFLVILETVGINITTLNVLAGAVGIGIGFGLQNIANNFISGLIILFERPIKVGDRIEIDKVNGDVKKIGPRSTTILTNDNITIIVPNSKFISENVVNWSLANGVVRFKIPVTVGYDSDIDLVMNTLLEIAAENEDVLEEPQPTVRLVELGESGVTFELRAWSRIRLHKPRLLKSDINLQVLRRFRAKNIELPFPQRDIRLRDAGHLVEVLRAGTNGKGSKSSATSAVSD